MPWESQMTQGDHTKSGKGGYFQQASILTGLWKWGQVDTAVPPPKEKWVTSVPRGTTLPELECPMKQFGPPRGSKAYPPTTF